MSKGLQALKEYRNQQQGVNVYADELLDIIEKELKALNEILALYNKWLGNEMSDFEFFTLLNEVRNKYDLLKEVFNNV